MEVNTKNILVVLSIITGLISTLFFITTGLFKSPLTNVALILAVTSGILYGTENLDDRSLNMIGRLIFVLSSIITSIYLITNFFTGDLVLAFSFALITIILILSAYLTTLDRKILTRQVLVGIVVIFVVLFGTFILLEATDGGENVNIELYDNAVSEDSSSDYHIGEMEVTNNGLIPKYYDTPRYGACFAGFDVSGIEEEMDRSVNMPNTMNVYVDNREDIIIRTINSDLYVVDRLNILDEYEDDEYEIVFEDECIEEPDTPTVTVFEA